MAKEAFNKKWSLLTSKLSSLSLRKKLVKSYVWSIALYGAETWTHRKREKKYLESFEMWCWRRIENIKWSDRVTSVEVLRRVGEKKTILSVILRRKANWIGHILRHKGLIQEVIEGMDQWKFKLVPT